jgi:primosomal protein N' (replication factor Y)
VPTACQVVPDIPSFAVDDGFTYLIPDGMHITVGSKVRVRVSGRRLNGYVTAVIEAPEGRKLLPIDSVSGNIPLFSTTTLDVCRWAATHYVSPMSVLLKRTGPANIARQGDSDARPDDANDGSGVHSVDFTISRSPHPDAIRKAVADTPSAGAIGVLVPTASEVAVVAEGLAKTFGDRVVTATSSMTAKETTRSWVAAATSADTILVGTREIALWPLYFERTWILVEEGRRVMKSPSTPTIHAREILLERTRRTGGRLHVIGPIPTLEVLSADAVVAEHQGRWWPNIEVSDRTLEPPTASLFTGHTKRVISKAVGDDRKVFVLVTARGYAPAFRCVACGELRLCEVCDTTASSEDRCRRCSNLLGVCRSCSGDRFEPLGAGIGRVIDDLSRFVGSDGVGEADSGRSVLVGSERDLVDLGGVDLGVVVDIDGMAGAPHYRAREDALRLAVRLANRAEGGGGRRLLVQTSNVAQPVVVALLAGDATGFLMEESEDRKRAAFPPYGELIALETADHEEADDVVRAAIGESATVRGPAPMKDRSRWLISGASLDEARILLRGAVDALRSKGARVRVDADPIDL